MAEVHRIAPNPRTWAARCLTFAVGVSTASAALASFGGGIQIGFREFFVIAAIMAIPGAVICALIEWFGARHPPPYWIAWPAAALGLAFQLMALQVVVKAGDRGWYLFVVPPLMTFALTGIMRHARSRMFVAWIATAAALAATIRVYRGESITGAVIGGATISMIAWQLAWWLRQRTLVSDPANAAAPARSPRSTAAASMTVDAAAARPRWIPEEKSGAAHPCRAGIRWWLAGAAIFYVAISLLTAVGYHPLAASMLAIEGQLLDFFGFPLWSLHAPTSLAWATHGLMWSAIFGSGTWAAAALGGRFDAGRLQPLRLLALVACLTLFVAIGLNTKATKRMWELEEAAAAAPATPR